MTDTNTLLMMVLKKHFKDRPEVLDRALTVIKDYSNNSFTQDQYDKTLNTLLVTMCDLPTNILHYFLTMVPLPKKVDNEEIPLSEAMKNFQIPSAQDAQNCLLAYLKNEDDLKLNCHADDDNVNKSKMSEKNKADNKDPDYVVPSKKPKIGKATAKSKEKLSRKNDSNKEECKKLLDICAEYVIGHQSQLERYYKTRKEKVWKLVNNNLCDGDDLLKCYDLIKDLNKKAKWIRSIDDEDVLSEIITEEYKNSDIFLKLLHLPPNFDEDPFVLGEKFEKAIDDFINS